MQNVDAETGRLANEYCPNNVVREVFIAGTEPSESCSPYRGGLFGAPLRGMPLDTTMRPDSVPARPPGGGTQP